MKDLNGEEPRAGAPRSVIEPGLVAEMAESVGPGGMAMLTDCLATETRALIGTLRAEISAGDAGAAGATLHGIKGAALNLGCIALGEAASDWEMKAKAGALPQADLPEALQDLLDLSLGALASILDAARETDVRTGT